MNIPIYNRGVTGEIVMNTWRCDSYNNLRQSV